MLADYTLPRASVQQVLQRHAVVFNSAENAHVQKVLHHIYVCRTAALGYHVYRCTKQDCNYLKYQ